MRWDLATLRSDVERIFTQGQLSIVNQCLRTIIDRRNLARYHYHEAKEKMDSVVQDRANEEIVGAMLGAFDTDDLSFDDMRFQAYAHTVACVHNMRAVVDNFVYFTYHALGLNLDDAQRIKNERSIDWTNVSKRLPSGPIKDALASLNDDPGFQYLVALDNHSKHRSIIEVNYSISFESGAHGLRFIPFIYKDTSYPPTWVRSTLRTEYDRQETLFRALGTSINAELAGRPTRQATINQP